jgi:hypothetical protein
MNHKYIKHKKKERGRDLIRRTEHLHNAINSTEIVIGDCREIFDDAVEFVYGKPNYEYLEKDIDAIMVNNIRHNYSNYDEILRGRDGIIRSEYDYMQYKNCVLDKIADSYPSLRDACEKQKRKCNMVRICKG